MARRTRLGAAEKNAKGLGSIAGYKIVSVRKTMVNGVEFNEVTLENMTTTILSDADLAAQKKS